MIKDRQRSVPSLVRLGGGGKGHVARAVAGPVTRESGLLYETRPNNPYAAALQDALKSAIEALQAQVAEATGIHTLRDADFLGVHGHAWPRVMRGYDIVVVSRQRRLLATALAGLPGWRVMYSGRDGLVLQRAPR